MKRLANLALSMAETFVHEGGRMLFGFLPVDPRTAAVDLGPSWLADGANRRSESFDS